MIYKVQYKDETFEKMSELYLHTILLISYLIERDLFTFVNWFPTVRAVSLISVRKNVRKNTSAKKKMKPRKNETCMDGCLRSRSVREPKVPFRVFDQLKNEIQNSILRFCFYFNKEDEIQITDYHFHV